MAVLMLGGVGHHHFFVRGAASLEFDVRYGSEKRILVPGFGLVHQRILLVACDFFVGVEFVVRLVHIAEGHVIIPDDMAIAVPLVTVNVVLLVFVNVLAIIIALVAAALLPARGCIGDIATSGAHSALDRRAARMGGVLAAGSGRMVQGLLAVAIRGHVVFICVAINIGMEKMVGELKQSPVLFRAFARVGLGERHRDGIFHGLIRVNDVTVVVLAQIVLRDDIIVICKPVLDQNFKKQPFTCARDIIHSGRNATRGTDLIDKI